MIKRLKTAEKLFAVIRWLSEDSSARDVSILSGETFLFASFESGREQVLDIRAIDDEVLARCWSHIHSDAGASVENERRRIRPDRVPARV